MERRDYLMRQIDKVGVLLAKLLAEMLQKKKEGGLQNAAIDTIATLKQELEIDFEELSLAPEADFLPRFIESSKLTTEQLSALANILYELYLTRPFAQPEAMRHFGEKILILFDYLDQTENVVSFDRRNKADLVR